MKNFFEKIKNYSFWVSLSAGVIILLNALGKAFGFQIENQIVEDIIMSIAGLLVVFGIVTMNENNKETKLPPENDEKKDENVIDEKKTNEDDIEQNK